MAENGKTGWRKVLAGVLWPFTWAWWLIKWTAWLLFKAVTSPVWLTRWIIRGGHRWFWENFGSYIFATAKWEGKGPNRQIVWIRFVHYPDIIHIHPMVWGCLLLALIELFFHFQFVWVAVVFSFVLVYCFLAVRYDFPPQRTVWNVVLGLLTLSLADFGVSQIAPLVGRLIALPDWVPAWMQYFITLQWLHRGVLFLPTWDFIHWIHPFLSAGMLVLFAVGAQSLLLKPVFLAWLNNRVQLDPREVIEWRFGEGSKKEPIYMRGLNNSFPDLFELLAGFGDLTIATAKGTLNYHNVFGLSWWLLGPYNALAGKGAAEEERRARQEVHEDAANLVEGLNHHHHDETAGGHGHDGEHQDDGDQHDDAATDDMPPPH